MPLTAKIVSVKRDRYQASGEEYLDVRLRVIDKSRGEEEIVDEKKFGFPVQTSQEEITEAVRKHIRLVEQEREVAKKQKEQDELDKKVDETSKSLTGMEISLEETSVSDSQL